MVGTHHEEHKDGGNENPGCTGVRVPDVGVNTVLFTWSLHDTHTHTHTQHCHLQNYYCDGYNWSLGFTLIHEAEMTATFTVGLSKNNTNPPF